MADLSQELRDLTAVLKINNPIKDEIEKTWNLSGVTPATLAGSTMFKSYTLTGITPLEFETAHSATTFDYFELKTKFAEYCKDYNDELNEGTKSRALEFSSKMLFEVGPGLKEQKKTKGDKLVKFRFCYSKKEKEEDIDSKLHVKPVIVTTFRDNTYKKMEEKGNMILTFKQAGLLAMETFLKASYYLYMHKQQIIMTPLCGAVFSRDAVKDIAIGIDVEIPTAIKIINASCTSAGQYLEDSNLGCAIAAMICATKRMSDKSLKSAMISKLVKQYSSQGKQNSFSARRYDVFCEFALGGVPQGLDADTLLNQYENSQVKLISKRSRALISNLQVQTLKVNESTSTPNVDIPVVPSPKASGGGKKSPDSRHK